MVNSSGAQAVLAEMMKGGDSDPSHIVEASRKAHADARESSIGVFVKRWCCESKSVGDYRGGKKKRATVPCGSSHETFQRQGESEMACKCFSKTEIVPARQVFVGVQ